MDLYKALQRRAPRDRFADQWEEEQRRRRDEAADSRAREDQRLIADFLNSVSTGGLR